MTRMICLRASSDCKRLTKHENTGLGWVIAASRSVCDTPVLRIRETKFRKSRLVPLHPTVVEALKRYLGARCQLASDSDWLFLSTEHRQMCLRIVNYTFRCVTRRAGILSERSQQPRIHDLRHTFATRVLEQCGAGRSEVARHFVALSTYLGHVSIHNTYWYLQATPEMMADIAAAAETLFREDDA